MASAKSFFLVLAALTGVCQGYWRMGCGTVQTGRIDPIVNPGKLSGHAHKIVGASSTSQSSSKD